MAAPSFSSRPARSGAGVRTGRVLNITAIHSTGMPST